MVRRYDQEALEALKEQRHQNPGQKPKPEGSFLRPSLGYPVAYPFAPGNLPLFVPPYGVYAERPRDPPQLHARQPSI